jgi:hypothetical protein
MEKILKLMNGDTIMGTAEVVGESGVTLKDPVALEMSQESGAYSLISFMWVPLDPKSTTRTFIKSDHIITSVPMSEDILSYYRRSLAMLKGDVEEMRRIISEEREEMLDFSDEDEYDSLDDKILSFPTGKSANTVH